jgi:hypothetical protein
LNHDSLEAKYLNTTANDGKEQYRGERMTDYMSGKYDFDKNFNETTNKMIKQACMNQESFVKGLNEMTKKVMEYLSSMRNYKEKVSYQKV